MGGNDGVTLSEQDPAQAQEAIAFLKNTDPDSAGVVRTIYRRYAELA